MTEIQKRYIEDNIELIENNDWETFFQNAPDGMGGVLYEAGVDFMNHLREIPRACFERFLTNEIMIPRTITSIGTAAFFSCRNLTQIKIPNSVTSIGPRAFFYCTSLTSVSIPDSVTSIDTGAFSNCDSLKSISIPNSVTSIGEEAFSDCKNKLHIEYEGTQEEWESILSRNVFKRTRYECICTDGVVKKIR